MKKGNYGGGRVVWGLLRTAWLVLVVVGLTWPVWIEQVPLPEEDVAPPTDPSVIADYRADLAIAADGVLTATETLVVVLPEGRHGIYRYFDTHDQSDPTIRYQPDLGSVTVDGAPATVETTWSDDRRYVVARVGDADITLPAGPHTYVITYSVPGVIAPSTLGESDTFPTVVPGTGEPAASVFFWKVVAPGWEMPINAATVNVTLPAPTTLTQCWSGSPADQTCAVAGSGTNQLTVSAHDLPPRSGMTLRASMALPAPERDTLPWTPEWDRVWGTDLMVRNLVLLLTAAAGVFGWYLSYRVRERKPGFPVLFEPPQGLGPVQTAYLEREDVGEHPLVATLLHLKALGLISIEPQRNGFRVTGVRDAARWEQVDYLSRNTGMALSLDAGETVEIDGGLAIGTRLARATDKLAEDAAWWGAGERLVIPDRIAKRSAQAWVIALLGAVALLLFAPVTMWVLPAAAFVFTGSRVMRKGASTKRSPEGRVGWSRAGGFRRFLSTRSAEDRFDFAAQQDVYLKYLPYAVSFGVAKAWAKKYRKATGLEPPAIIASARSGGSDNDYFARGGLAQLASFEQSLGRSIGAYEAKQAAEAAASRSSSSGSSGGGGGGGGGSW